uniref:phenylalanine--tRNA ligase n=2 Tax=Prasinoderma coloniale TaxID=156133 RepID=A0A7R9Y643_9VIRI|eukprot:PRCOL_00000627-RA
MEAALLRAIDAAGDGGGVDSQAFAAAGGYAHGDVLGLVRSLVAAEMVAATDVEIVTWGLTAEGQEFVEKGSAEARVHAAVPADGIELAKLKAELGKLADVGLAKAMQAKWLQMQKGEVPMVLRKTDEIVDTAREQLRAVAGGAEHDKKTMDLLKKRKLIAVTKSRKFVAKKGPAFALERVKFATDLTAEMLQSGAWKDAKFKAYNLDTLGAAPDSGAFHPLMKVRAEFRQIFLEMGFAEMPTNNFVESSFWNFDALFQPQQHPARDAHDTFFLNAPEKATSFPEEYLERVRKVHESGGYGSFGYNYYWKRSEAEKNLLRTHTTAVSSRMLYKLAQEGFRPQKYFSIDRVFRNEAVDRTHLAEFHQVEGVVCDRNLSLGHLMGQIRSFFERIGMPSVRFKPAYNPYTEPSMEIFAFHQGLGKWVEVGNSGVFRPEMLRPMGLPEDVTVIAWGLSLERPTMILYGIDNIRDLFGHKTDLDMIQSNPICRLGMDDVQG